MLFIFCVFIQVSVWDINKVSSKVAEFSLHFGSTGIYNYRTRGGDNTSEGGYDEMASTKLLAYDSDGNHMLCCSPSGLMIYKVILFIFICKKNSRDFKYTGFTLVQWCIGSRTKYKQFSISSLVIILTKLRAGNFSWWIQSLYLTMSTVNCAKTNDWI